VVTREENAELIVTISSDGKKPEGKVACGETKLGTPT